jgi:hypothetical protein
MKVHDCARRAAVAAVLCGTVACGEPDAPRTSAELPSVQPLAGTVLYGGDRLSRPQSIGVTDDWVLVGDVPRPHALHVISRTNGRHLASWGREGEGPGEFSSLWGLQPADAGQVWLFDPAQTRLTLLDVPALLADAPAPLRRTLVLRGEYVPMTAVWVADSLLMSSGMFSGGRLAQFDSIGSPRRVVGPLPPAKPNVPAAVAQHAYSGTLVRHPSRPLLAIGTRHADRVEIYRVDGALVTVARGSAKFEPVYEPRIRGNTPVMGTGDDLRFGYVDLFAAGDRLYALYSGVTRGERPGKASFGGEVHVFDWDGRLRARYALDALALGIAVAPDGRTLYAIRHDPEPAVLRYPLPRG